MRSSSLNYLACLCLGSMAACQAGTATPVAPVLAKVNPRLEAAAESLTQGAATPARTDAQGRLQIYAYVTDTTPDTLTKLARAGLVSGQPSPAMGVVQGWVAPHDLAALAGLSCVKALTLPDYGSTR